MGHAGKPRNVCRGDDNKWASGLHWHWMVHYHLSDNDSDTVAIVQHTIISRPKLSFLTIFLLNPISFTSTSSTCVSPLICFSTILIVSESPEYSGVFAQDPTAT